MKKDAEAIKVKLPEMMNWFGAYTPPPSIISMNGSYKEA